MRDLIAVKRVDKHGREVTKWVKPSNATAAGSTPIPGPQMLDSRKRSRLISKLANVIGREGLDDHTDVGVVLDQLHLWSDKTLTVMQEAMTKNRELKTAMFYAVREHSEREAREVAFFDAAFHNDAEVHIRAALLNGLRDYSRFHGIDDLTELDEEQYEIAAALLRVGYEINYTKGGDEALTENRSSYGLYHYYLSDRAWVELIEQNTGRVEDICEFVRSRNINDAAAVREYLEDGTALREGYL